MKSKERDGLWREIILTEKKATEVRREEIIAASLSLVEQYGLEKLNISDIAKAVDLVPSAIYRHFGGKEEIIESLIEFAGAYLQGNISQTLLSENHAVGRLEVLFDLHVKLIKEQPAIPRILFSLLSNDKNSRLKQKILLVINKYVGNITKIIADGQAKGEIPSDIDDKAAGILFLGMVQPLAILSQSSDGLSNHCPESLWKIYRRGITC